VANGTLAFLQDMKDWLETRMHHHLSRTEKRKKGAYRLRQRCTMSLIST
jgi:hypothetical protein